MKLVCLEKNTRETYKSFWDGRGYFRRHEEVSSFIDQFKNIKVVVRPSLSHNISGHQLIAIFRKRHAVNFLR